MVIATECNFSEDKCTTPAHIIEVNLGMVSQASFVRASAVVMLHTIGIKGLDLPIVLCDDQLHQHLSLWREQQALQLVRILQLLQGLHINAMPDLQDTGFEDPPQAVLITQRPGRSWVDIGGKWLSIRDMGSGEHWVPTLFE